MIKKILVLLLLFLCSCSKDSKQLEYLDPVKDVFIFGELDGDVQNRIKAANGNKEYKNYFNSDKENARNKDFLDLLSKENKNGKH